MKASISSPSRGYSWICEIFAAIQVGGFLAGVLALSALEEPLLLLGSLILLFPGSLVQIVPMFRHHNLLWPAWKAFAIPVALNVGLFGIASCFPQIRRWLAMKANQDPS